MTDMSPKRQIAPPSAAERARRFARTVLARLRRLDRRLRPPMTAAVLVLATALAVFTDLPGEFWLLAVIEPLLLGCALWLLYECLRHLLITRIHH